MLPSISIITPTLNQAPLIKKTIESVLTQNYPKLEYIIIDGASTDGTVELLKEYGNSIIWTSEADNCQVDAINKGLRIATGEVVAYLNSDDYYAPGALIEVGRFFENLPHAKILIGKCHNVDIGGRPTRSFITTYKNYWLRKEKPKLLKIGNYISQPATFWKQELHDLIGYFNPEFRYAMDYDFWLRVSARERIYFLDKYLASFRIYPMSITSSNSKNQFAEEHKVASNHTDRNYKVLHLIHSKLSYLGYLFIKKSKLNNIVDKKDNG